MNTQKSFYDLDYIVELSEKRVEQFTAACQLVLGRLSNIILIYTAIGIYLIPIVQDFPESNSWIFKGAMLIMLVLIVCSIIFTIKLMWPAYISYLEISGRYIEDLRGQYEIREIKPDMGPDEIEQVKNRINRYLKASYIDELNIAQVNNQKVFQEKSAHYYRAFLFGLMAAAPYVLCIGYHISRRDEKVQKVEITNAKNVVHCVNK